MLENQFQQRASCAGVPKVLPQASLAVYLGVKLKSILWEEARNVNTDICNQKNSKKCFSFVSTVLFFHPKLFCTPSLRGLVMVDLKKLRKVQGLSDASSLCWLTRAKGLKEKESQGRRRTWTLYKWRGRRWRMAEDRKIRTKAQWCGARKRVICQVPDASKRVRWK